MNQPRPPFEPKPNGPAGAPPYGPAPGRPGPPQPPAGQGWRSVPPSAGDINGPTVQLTAAQLGRAVPPATATAPPRRTRWRRTALAIVLVLIGGLVAVVGVRIYTHRHNKPISASSGVDVGPLSGGSGTSTQGFTFRVVPEEVMPTAGDMSTIFGGVFHAGGPIQLTTKLEPRWTDPERCSLFTDPSTAAIWVKALSTARQFLPEGPPDIPPDAPIGGSWAAAAVFRTAEDASASLSVLTGMGYTCPKFSTGQRTTEGLITFRMPTAPRVVQDGLDWDVTTKDGAYIANGVAHDMKCSQAYRVVENLVVAGAKCGIEYTDAGKITDWLIATAKSKNQK